MPATIAKENHFWLQILGDYARFMRNTIYPTAVAEVERIKRFIESLDDLLAQSRKELPDEELMLLNRQAYQAVQDFRKFILYIIKKQISENSIIVMAPAVLNEYVNDTERYLDILSVYMKENRIMNPVSDNITWLLKIYIGAIHLQDSIGISSIEYKRKTQKLADTALDLYLRSHVAIGLRRTNLRSYPALEQLITEVQNRMTEYAEYLIDLIRLIKEKKLLGSVTLLDLDNQYRQMCYYLTKLSMFSEIRPPICDPANPRDSE